MPVLKQTESTYTPIPPGAYVARCYGIVSLGTQPSPNPQFKPAFKVVALFELPNELLANGKPMGCSHFLNAYLGSPKKPSKTAQFLTAWRGRAFTAEEAAGFDLMKVVGAPAMVNIVHNEHNGKVREAIASISPLPKGMTCPPQINPAIRYEIEQGKDATYNSLPAWMQTMIAGCVEWTTPPPSAEASHEDAAADAIAAENDTAVPF